MRSQQRNANAHFAYSPRSLQGFWVGRGIMVECKNRRWELEQLVVPFAVCAPRKAIETWLLFFFIIWIFCFLVLFLEGFQTLMYEYKLLQSTPIAGNDLWHCQRKNVSNISFN